MAYGDSGSGNGLSNKSVTFKGFSSRADKRNFKLYDFEVAKQDLIPWAKVKGTYDRYMVHDCISILRKPK